MAINQLVGIFTTKMRLEFINAYMATAEPAPYEKYTTIVPSTARIENYSWMSPSPGIALYAGHRRYGKIDTIRYSVENKEFDSGFEVLLRDIQDDQIGGYEIKPKELAERAKKWPSKWVINTLSLAKTLNGFDGSPFVATTHNIGSYATNGNQLSYTSSGSSDGKTYKLIALYHGGLLKPMIWQARKQPEFMTTAGTPQSSEAKIVRYWIDMEGQAAFGYWWDAIWIDITNTPSVNDIHSMFALVEAQFRTFQLPIATPAEIPEYIHEQTVFSQENLTFAGSTGLGEALRQALQQDWAPQIIGSNMVATTNRFKGYANYVVSALLN
jgi:phage major head subunit gpT-like protein